MDPMHLKKSQVAAILQATFPKYTGRKFSIEFRPWITFYDVNWSGGTRNEYKLVRMDGALASIPNQSFFSPYENLRYDIPEDVIVVCHCIFCGHDLGIRLYANPCNLPKWLPAPKS